MKSITITTSTGLTAHGIEFKGTTFVNLSPHALNMITRDHGTLTVDPPVLADGSQAKEADLPRLGQLKTETTEPGDPLRTFITRFEDPVNVPDPIKGVMFVVSVFIASAMPARGRQDFVSVNLFRDTKGVIVGADGFVSSL